MVIKIIVINLILNIVITAIFIYILLIQIDKKILNQFNDSKIKFIVEDSGIGIVKDDLEHIFDKFFRVKNDKTRYINGTGLGLAIVKNIVEAHHGTIDVDSRENEGTCFTLYFPK